MTSSPLTSTGEDFEDFLASEDLGLALIRPARKDEKTSRPFPNWLRQRVEVVIRALKNQLGLRTERYRVFCTIDEERLAVQIDHVARLP